MIYSKAGLLTGVTPVDPTPENQGLLNREKLALMQRHALLVLISRAHLVDFDALTEAVLEERIQAAIDVFPEEPLTKDHPIRQASDAILSPHRAAAIIKQRREIGRMVVDDVAEPVPGPGQALVRVAGCGVCHTDLGFLHDGVKPRAPLPLALGHEISGVVEDAGLDFAHLVGRAVIVPAVTPCGECAECRAGNGTLCARQVMPGNDVHGGFGNAPKFPVPHQLLLLLGEGEIHQRLLGRPSTRSEMMLRWISLVPA